MAHKGSDDLRKIDRLFYRDLHRTYPIILKGEGIHLFDETGKRYIDFASGIAVANLGYDVREVVEAMHKQSQNVSFVYNAPFTNEPQIRLSHKVTTMAPEGLNQVLFLNGGSEAVEAAIKLARQYHVERGNAGKFRVISRWNSYHGNTLGALSASGRPSWRALFAPYILPFPHVTAPYAYRRARDSESPEAFGRRLAAELEQTIVLEGPETISAFIAEPVIGTSVPGAVPPPNYYPLIREICSRYDVLFIADEVITGFGRTGSSFGIKHWQTIPDVIVAGKGIAGGYGPLSAVLVHDHVAEVIRSGSGGHTQGYTYSGHPVAVAAGLAAQDYIEKHGLIERVQKMEPVLRQTLERLKPLGIVGEVRGKGFLFGVEFVLDPARKEPFPAELNLTVRIVSEALRRGLMVVGGTPGVVDGVRGDQLQITPAFVTTAEQMAEAGEILYESINAVLQEDDVAAARR